MRACARACLGAFVHTCTHACTPTHTHALVDVVESLGVTTGAAVVRVASSLDATRLQYAYHTAKEAPKTTRKRKALEKMQLDVRQHTEEDNMTQSDIPANTVSPVAIACVLFITNFCFRNVEYNLYILCVVTTCW